MNNPPLIDGMGRELHEGDVVNLPRVQTQIKWVITKIENVPYVPPAGIPDLSQMPPPRVIIEAHATLKVQMAAGERTDMLRYATAEELESLSKPES